MKTIAFIVLGTFMVTVFVLLVLSVAGRIQFDTVQKLSVLMCFGFTGVIAAILSKK